MAGTTDNSEFISSVSFSPTANVAQTLFVANQSTGATASTLSVSGLGLTWSELVTHVSGTGFVRMSAFRAVGTPIPGTITMTFDAPQQALLYRLVEWSGASIAGSNASSAVVQITSTANSFGVGSSIMSLSMSAKQNSSHVQVVAFAARNSTQVALDGAWTRVGTDAGVGSPPFHWGLAWTSAEDLTISSTHVGANIEQVGIMLEIGNDANVAPGAFRRRTSFSLMGVGR